MQKMKIIICFGKIFQAINKIAQEQGIDKNGFRVITNCGKDAGQEVLHLHYHILAGKALGTKIV
jgi:histidine triad (HIT) family protein